MRARQFRFITLLACIATASMAAPVFAQFGHPLKGTWIGEWGRTRNTSWSS